jgi:hypothetical protein
MARWTILPKHLEGRVVDEVYTVVPEKIAVPPRKSPKQRTAEAQIKSDWAIGIDPGTKTGVAVWNVKTQKFHFVFTYTIFEALTFVENWIGKTEGVTHVVIEDARKRFKIPEKDGKPDVARLQGAGSVKRDSAIWQEACEYWKLNFGTEKFSFKMVAPNGQTNALAKDKELSSRNFGITYGTTEHARCAAFLVWKM